MSINMPDTSIQVDAESVVYIEPSHIWETEGAESDVISFFSDDDGVPLLPASGELELTIQPELETPVFAPLARAASVYTVNTVVSSTTISISLSELCDMIEERPSLRRAEIRTTEAYAEHSGAVLHRFLVLELHRENKKKIWLRLDRRAGQSTFGLLRAGGRVPAHDVLAANKSALIGSARAENHQVFTTLPTLEELQYFLRVICDELKTHQIWPANCWFFCSLVQQHLAGTNDGRFENGALPHPNLAQDVRNRIADRLRRFYNNPVLFSISALLESIQHDDTRAIITPALTLSRRLDASRDLISVDGQRLASKLSKALRDAADGLSDSGYTEEAVNLLQQSVSLSRALCASSSDQYLPELALSLLSYGIHLQRLTRYEEARTIGANAVVLTRQLYGGGRERYLAQLALALSSYGGSLHGMKAFHDACEVQAEAVDLRQQLYRSDKDRYRPDLADALHNYGASLCRVDRHSEACVADAEALALRRTLYERDSEKYRSQLALTLYIYGVSLSAVGRQNDACAVEAEAAALRHLLYERSPNDVQCRADLAASLHNYGISLRGVGRIEDACVVQDEAVRLHRQLFAENPERYRDDLAEAILEYAATLRTIGRTMGAGELEGEGEASSMAI